MNINTWYTITERPHQSTPDLLRECESKFPLWTWQDIEKFDEFLAPKEATTRTFKPNIEADEEHKNKSCNRTVGNGMHVITLRERLIMELQYFAETGKHLDVYNVTITSSLYSGGSVASVDWHAGKLCVGWCIRDRAHPSLRVREAGVPVPLTPSPLIPLTAASAIKKGARCEVRDGKVYPLKTCTECGKVVNQL